LARVGQRESSTARLEEAVAAYRENTRERVPLNSAKTQNNLKRALKLLDERKTANKISILCHECVFWS
jgi:hypothetical protein